MNSDPKQWLIDKLSQDHSVEKIRGHDILALNSRAVLYLRFNKNSGATKDLMGKFWFGITKTEYDKYQKENFYIICICGIDDKNLDCIVLPASSFEVIRKDISVQSGQWKFNILKRLDGKFLMQISDKGKIDITEFANYFDFSPNRKNIEYTPAVYEIATTSHKAPKAITEITKPVTLSEQLLASSKNSDEPKQFEQALSDYFQELGFEAKKIGGPGETDVLVSKPARFIIDGKSTKTSSKSNINFTRIKRHMKENHAENMIIASVAFDPAVIKDAKMENATLIEVDSLINILEIHYQYVLSPFSLSEVFRKPGLVSKDDIKAILDSSKFVDKFRENVLILLENIDYGAMNIDEIKGRVDQYCKMKKLRAPSRDVMANILRLLSTEPYRILNCVDEIFSSYYPPEKALERFRACHRLLNES